jgi:hypothetical protein
MVMLTPARKVILALVILIAAFSAGIAAAINGFRGITVWGRWLDTNEIAHIGILVGLIILIFARLRGRARQQ